ncbi:MAG TPA: sugar transferase [Terricaulis sp.]|nr:sugar transferase [Terricaulis sp.]HRP09670.1 sugar transferase [Terricaulis sp.]
MLVQLPRGPGQPKATSDGECTSFEAALRRDLASAPVISYDVMLGGWSKRALDVALTLLAAPVWAPAMLIAAAWSKMRHPAPVFIARERIGYGGRAFSCYGLRISPPTAVIEQLRPNLEETPVPANDWRAIASRAETSRAKWRRLFESLPELLNVLRGEMSLVGPAPLSAEELEPLKTSKRYYLSARPGVVGIASIADADEEDPGHYKIYALSWSLGADLLVLWDGLRGLRQKGELWRPSFKLKRGNGKVPARRRNTAAG